jgi:hypothetical protein
MSQLTHPNFVKPRYDSGGFASIPLRVRDLLSARKVDTVILLLADGFGWRFFEKFQDEPFFKKLQTAGGQFAKLTSQFPSTTAAHITTLHTGLTVGEHGLIEWNMYEPTLDAVITPLLFSFAGTPERDTLKPAGVNPHHIYPSSTLYQPLKKQGVSASIFQHREYTPSTYSDAVYRGASARGYKTIAEGLVNLGLALSAATSSPKGKPPAYFVTTTGSIPSATSTDLSPRRRLPKRRCSCSRWNACSCLFSIVKKIGPYSCSPRTTANRKPIQPPRSTSTAIRALRASKNFCVPTAPGVPSFRAARAATFFSTSSRGAWTRRRRSSLPGWRGRRRSRKWRT